MAVLFYIAFMTKNILILLSHPDYEHSVANRALIDAVSDIPGLTVHHLEKSGRNGIFDLDKEMELLRRADLIVWQFPLYWYSCPASLRDWQDQVLSPIVYGPDNFIKNKFVQIAFTAGSRESAFRAGDIIGYTPAEMLRPLQMTVNASGMRYLPPFGVFEARDIPADDLKKASIVYKNLLLK